MISQLFRKLKRPGEVITLQKKKAILNDAIGTKRTTWEDVQELKGIIKEKREKVIDGEGERESSASPLSSVKTVGFFKPFHLESNLKDYRIKRTTPGKSTEYFKIYYDYPDLVVRGREEFKKVVLRRKVE